MKKVLFIIISILATQSFAQTNINAGLIAYYPFTGNANDQTANANHGVVVGSSLTVGKNGSPNTAYLFGSGSRIKVDTNTTFNFENHNQLTLSAWFYATALNPIVSSILSLYKQGGIELQIVGSGSDAGKLRVVNFNGYTMTTQFEFLSDSVVSLNQWNHVLLEINQTDSTTRLYLNNRLCGEIKNKIFSFPNAGFVIGNHITNPWHLIGKIDEVRIYNRLLTTSEKEALAGINLSDLIAHYTFNGDANDQTPYANHGTVVGATLSTDKAGNPNSAYLFGSGNRIKVDTNTTFNFENHNQLTLSAWFYATALNPIVSSILSLYKQGGIELQILGSGSDAGKLRVVNFNGYTMTTQFEFLSDSVVSLNQWNHVLLEINQTDSTTKLYLNNRLCGEIKNKIFSFPNAGFVIGNHITNPWHFIGKIDEVRLYKKLLTPEERIELTGINLSVKNLHGSYNINEVEIYPNPAKDFVTISAHQNLQIGEVTIMNPIGQIIIQQKSNSDISLSALNPGIYLVSVKDIDGRIISIKRLIKE